MHDHGTEMYSAHNEGKINLMTGASENVYTDRLNETVCKYVKISCNNENKTFWC